MFELKRANGIKIIISLNIICISLLIFSLNSNMMETKIIEDGEITYLGWEIDGFTSEPYDNDEIDYSILCSPITQSTSDTSTTDIFCDFEESGNFLKPMIYIGIIIISFSTFYLVSLLNKWDIFTEKTINYIDKYIFLLPLLIITLGFALWFIISPTNSDIDISFSEMDYESTKTTFSTATISIILSLMMGLFSFSSNRNWRIHKHWNSRNKQPKKSNTELLETPFEDLEIKLNKINNLFSEGIISEEERDKLRENEISKSLA